ncbi:hypothetical protein BLNAU_11331 [Blattamonas nauphoetae]|uniref:Uncharacterized protein n=1 Tax=Blattamonas nauphoetae TaxID=2049346 RepID=A0ABQ9XQG9_9EUKA|nr:hypothetical protein BLNAU_11331 [Blattamonas nauphoetae]
MLLCSLLMTICRNYAQEQFCCDNLMVKKDLRCFFAPKPVAKATFRQGSDGQSPQAQISPKERPQLDQMKYHRDYRDNGEQVNEYHNGHHRNDCFDDFEEKRRGIDY